jgi:hypothetical protein
MPHPWPTLSQETELVTITTSSILCPSGLQIRVLEAVGLRGPLTSASGRMLVMVSGLVSGEEVSLRSIRGWKNWLPDAALHSDPFLSCGKI